MPETAPRADADEVQMTDPPPAFDENCQEILRDWLGVSAKPS